MSVRTVADGHLEDARKSLQETLDSVHKVLSTKEDSEYNENFEYELYDIAKQLHTLKRKL